MTKLLQTCEELMPNLGETYNSL